MTDLSVVAPLYNESENVQPLVDWILEALAGYSGTYEVILVDDGSRDDTWERIAGAAASHPTVHGLRLGRNVGQTAAMMAGFDHAQGRVIVSLDGDLQNDPRDIPTLVAKLDEGYDLVCGWRQRRQDKLILRKVAHEVASDCSSCHAAPTSEKPFATLKSQPDLCFECHDDKQKERKKKVVHGAFEIPVVADLVRRLVIILGLPLFAPFHPPPVRTTHEVHATAKVDGRDAGLGKIELV